MPWCVTQPVKQLPPAFSEQLVSGDTKKLTRSAKLPKGRGQLIEQTVELYNPRKPFSFRYRFRTAIQIARFHSLIKSRWTIYHLHLSIQFLLFSYSVSDAPPPTSSLQTAMLTISWINDSASLVWMTYIKSCWRPFWNFVKRDGEKKDQYISAEACWSGSASNLPGRRGKGQVSLFCLLAPEGAIGLMVP